MAATQFEGIYCRTTVVKPLRRTCYYSIGIKILRMAGPIVEFSATFPKFLKKKTMEHDDEDYDFYSGVNTGPNSLKLVLPGNQRRATRSSKPKLKPFDEDDDVEKSSKKKKGLGASVDEYFPTGKKKPQKKGFETAKKSNQLRKKIGDSDDEPILVVDDPNSFYDSDDYDSDGRIVRKEELKKQILEQQRMERSMKRKKNTPHLIKKYTPVPVDEQGRPIFPINLRGLTIHSLGKVVWDRPKFHAKRYIWPVGFKSSRTYSSMTELDKK
jgi:hypothetical protein